MRYDLFSYNNIDTTTCTFIDMPDAEVYLYSSLFMCQEADDLFDTLKNNISWQQQQIKLYAKYMTYQDSQLGMANRTKPMFIQA